MNKLLVVCGPTATGKTALAIKLAKKFNGELVSADSRQVYKGMDIGTGKDLPTNEKRQRKIKNYQIGYYFVNGVKIWLYDVVEPKYQFSVADYVRWADLVIKDILDRGKLPILVGGTGFYIKGVVDGIETLGVPPDWERRKKLNNLEMTRPGIASSAELKEKLREILERTCPERLRGMNESDRNNPRRLIRAIEIARYKSTSEVGGAPPKARGDTSEVKGRNVLFVGFKALNKILYERIDQRIDEMMKAGQKEEIGRLLEAGYSWDNSILGTTIGYREWREYMEHKTWNMEQKKETIQRWKFAEHGYARRQLTWFKKDPRIHWFDIAEKDWQIMVEDLVEKWYNSNNSRIYAN